MVRRSRAARGPVLWTLVGLALIAASCGNGESNDSPATGAGGAAEGPADEPRTGGSVTLLYHSDPGVYDTVRSRISSSGGTDAPIIVAIYDTLIRLSPDGEVIPRLAESVTSDDATTWEIKLRRDLTFSDGTPLDAASVEFNWERHLDPELASACASDARRLSTLTVSDPLTLTAELAAPLASFPSLLVGCLGLIGSPTAIEQLGAGFATAPVGAGPFVVTDYVMDDHMTLERNPTFWDSPRPYLDSIEVRVVPDPETRASTLRQQDDAVLFDCCANGAFAQLVTEGYDLVAMDLLGGTGVAFNLRTPPFDDARVRQAIINAVRPATVVEKASANVTEPVDTLFPASSPFFAPVEFPFDDLEGGQALIDEYIEENGGPVRGTLVIGTAFATYGEALHQEMSRLEGVELELRVVEASAFLDMSASGAFGIILSPLVGVDPDSALAGKITSDSTANVSGYANTEVDELLAAGRETVELDERAEDYRRVQEILVEDVPIVPIQRTRYLYIPGNSVQGLTTESMFGLSLWDPSVVWVEE